VEKFKIYWRETLVVILFVLNSLVWFAGIDQERVTMSVYFLDVGQGDAILIDSPTRGRILIDGGPDRSVLTELGKILPFGDKRIDVVIESHPDRDHIAGLPEVVSRFNVSAFIEPGVESANQIDDELHKRVRDKNIPDLLGRRNMVVDLKDGVKLIVLFPDRDVSRWETNDASIVAKLVYGDTSFLLTGDSTKKAEFILLGLDGDILNADVLKAGHHGSRTSTSLPYAEAVSPDYAVISAGKNNSYGHPHRETLDILNKVGAKVVSTADLGTLHFESDGKKLILK
jgi:competence protein ComEC